METTDMKDRIAHIIRAKNLTAADFAQQLGIQPSNVSHLLAGRNNPSLEFVKKLKETFPEYNTDWIIFGTGPMTVSEPFFAQKAAEEPASTPNNAAPAASDPLQGSLFDADSQTVSPVAPASNPVAIQGLSKIILVFDDNTFEVLSPR